MEHKGRWSLTMWILGALVLSCTASAKAQSASGPHWEIGVYGGGAWTSLPGDGDGALPPLGASFTTLGGSQSRRVASWFFGDGALLLNQLQATRPAPFGRSLVVPLDSLLTSSPIRRLSGPSLGVRVSRSLNRRFTLEGSIERGTGSLAFSRTAATVIASTRESVERTIREALPPLTQTVSTATDVRDGRGKSISVLATLKAQLFEWKSLTPFASFGGGWLRHSGRAPSFVAEAVYAVRSTFTAPPVTLTETDRVEVEYSVAKHVPTAAVSAGVDVALSRRWTWRIDARGQFSPNRVKGTLSATPDRTYVNGTAGSFAVVIGTNPTVQIGPIATTPGSLSQSVRDFVIFEGGGVERQFGLSTGLSWRF